MRKFKNPPTGRPRTPIADRFWTHVAKTDSCWLWLGWKDEHGYGWIRGEEGRSGKVLRAHRVAWELANGAIPEGQYVCHHCDNPSCVRPDHLFIGTHLENMRDCVRKGRYNGAGVHPEWRRGNCKLDERQVGAIRSAYANGRSIGELGKMFGVHRSTIGFVVHRKTWRHC